MKLEAKTPTETRLRAYLDENASDALREKIAALPDRFNLDAAWRFIQDEARKELKNKSGFLEDEVVFGWLVHYYEDVAPAEAAKPAPAPAKEEAKTRSARKGASARNRQPAAAAGSSKRRTEKEGRAVARKGSSGTPSTAQGVARPSPDSASSAPSVGPASVGAARLAADGTVSSPDPATALQEPPSLGGGSGSAPQGASTSAAGDGTSSPDAAVDLGPAATTAGGGSTASATASGFSFALFDSEGGAA